MVSVLCFFDIFRFVFESLLWFVQPRKSYIVYYMNITATHVPISNQDIEANFYLRNSSEKIEPCSLVPQVSTFRNTSGSAQ